MQWKAHRYIIPWPGIRNEYSESPAKSVLKKVPAKDHFECPE